MNVHIGKLREPTRIGLFTHISLSLNVLWNIGFLFLDCSPYFKCIYHSELRNFIPLKMPPKGAPVKKPAATKTTPTSKLAAKGGTSTKGGAATKGGTKAVGATKKPVAEPAPKQEPVPTEKGKELIVFLLCINISL